MTIPIDAKKLVLARLQTMPPNMKISVGGSSEAYDKFDLIREVEKETEIGKLVVNMHLTYLRSFKK